MREIKTSAINFNIDGASSSECTYESHHVDDEIDFQHFINSTTSEENAAAFTYSNKAVKNAGRNLRKDIGDLKSATAIIQQFRAAHEQPLNTIAYLIGRCCRELGLDLKPVTRLKRFETIRDKLQRKSLDGTTANATCVTNMHDIGGCRLICPDLATLRLVNDQLKKTITNGHRISIKDTDDYITAPKANDCGYRSLHVIYRYQHASGKSFNIEAQFRTMLQHIWATTVEIIDILEGTNIKTHSHSPCENKATKQVKWEELLAIISRYIANIEGEYQFSDEEQHKDTQRLIALEAEIHAITRLKSFNIMSEEVAEKCNGKTGHLLLVINEQTLHLDFWREFDDYSTAIRVYSGMEKLTQSDPHLNVLLVSTKDMSQLSKAYPNYLGDCASFVRLLENAIINS